MADAYWSYGNARYQAPASSEPAPGPVKRPRTDYGENSSAQQFVGYFSREEERVAQRAVRETETLGASYDRYLHNGQVPLFGSGESARPGAAEMHRHPVEEVRVSGVRSSDGRTVRYEGIRASDGRSVGYEGVRASDGRPVGYEGVRVSDGWTVGYEGVRMEKPLPPNASSTLFVEGLPVDCTRREVSRFREVRLVNKEPRRPGGEPWVLCFVDFSSPSQAAISLDSLEGYRFDEHDRDSLTLRIQFSRFPGPRSGGGRPRGSRR